MHRRLSWLSAFIGMATIFSGCIVSIALRNPGGEPVPVDRERLAILVAYFAFGAGSFVAIAIPAGMMLWKWIRQR